MRMMADEIPSDVVVPTGDNFRRASAGRPLNIFYISGHYRLFDTLVTTA